MAEEGKTPFIFYFVQTLALPAWKNLKLRLNIVICQKQYAFITKEKI